MEDKIIPIQPSDIISESMYKINQNFATLAESENVTEYKLLQWATKLDGEIQELKNYSDGKMVEMFNALDKISSGINQYDNVEEYIRNAVDTAMEDIDTFIRNTADQQISSSLGGYATTADLEGIQSALTTYKANNDAKTSSASMIAANSEFYRDGNGNFVKLNGATTNINSLDSFYNSLSAAEKQEIKGTSTETDPLSDPNVIQRLIGKAKETFKTVTTELASVRTIAESGSGSFDIVAAVRDNSVDGKAVTASIFGYANATGSGITLSADHLNLTGDELVIDTTNFKVNTTGNGNVLVRGQIEATSGNIGGIVIDNNSIKSSNDQFSLTSTGKLTANDVDITGKISGTSGNFGNLYIDTTGIAIRTDETEDNYQSGHLSCSGLSFTDDDLEYDVNIDVRGIRFYEGGSLIANYGSDGMYSETRRYNSADDTAINLNAGNNIILNRGGATTLALFTLPNPTEGAHYYDLQGKTYTIHNVDHVEAIRIQLNKNYNNGLSAIEENISSTTSGDFYQVTYTNKPSVINIICDTVGYWYTYKIS